MDIHILTHPRYTAFSVDWFKWRLAYEGGRRFIDTYLTKYSIREEQSEFDLRKKTTYNPAFTSGAINDVKNSIYCRLADVIRLGGPENYLTAVKGESGGVDLIGSSMDTYLGQKILIELLTMSRVGVYIDKPPYTGNTLYDSLNVRPYLYYYKTEDIRSWSTDAENKLITVLLKDTVQSIDPGTGLPEADVTRFRRLWLDKDGFVRVQFYDHEGVAIDLNGNHNENFYVQLGLREIPFVISELSDSLMKDLADYQIALLNLASSNLSYGLKSNFPFYTEQYDPRAENTYSRPAQFNDPIPDSTICNNEIYPTESVKALTNGFSEGTEVAARSSNVKEIKVGSGSGRRYPTGMERPGFIHPSSEPLKAALELKKDMENDIRQILNISIANLSPGYSSAASKAHDSKGLEAGLSYIGLELQNLERKIAHIWSLYEGKEDPTITYPKNYSLKSQKERTDESDSLSKQKNQVTSRLAKREFNKQIAYVLLGDKIPYDTLQAINSEIETAEYTESDPVNIQIDVELGLVDLPTASEARGYNGKKVVELAKVEHAARAAAIVKAQADAAPAARGVKDLAIKPGATGKLDKKNVDTTTKKKVRGQGQ